MSASAPAVVKTYRFGVFELHPASRQLFKSGREVHLQEQPLRLLMLLLEQPGEVRTREELRRKLWPTETFVEFDDGLNTAVQKIRQVLGDDARNPRFVETVPRRGYRLIAPVQADAAPSLSPDSTAATVPPELLAAAPALEAPPRRAARSYGTWVLTGAAAAGLAIGWLLPRGRSLPRPAPLRLSITPPAGVELRPGIRGGSAISPDGRTVAFVGSRNGRTMLWLRHLDSVTAQEIPGTENAQLPFWSPDSKSLGFLASGKIRRIDLQGGPPRELAAAGRPTRGAWTEDGTILFAAGAGGPIYRVRATGGTAVPATPADAGGAAWPYPIYGTDKFLYFHNGRKELELGTLSDVRQRTPLVASRSNAIYTPPRDEQPGYLLWMQGTTLVAQAFDPARGTLFDEVTPIAEGVGFVDRWRLVDLSASQNGVLLYGAGNIALSRLSWLRRDGSLLEYLSPPDWFGWLRLSPDGRRALIGRASMEGGIGSALWMVNFGRNLLTRVTFEQELSGWPAWSPDGRQIAYTGERAGRISLFRRDVSGAAPEERIINSTLAQYMYDWSRDGRYIIYCEVHPQTKLDLWVLPTTGERRPVPLLISPFNEDTPQFSPNARWIAYVSDESGRNEVYVTGFPGARGKWQISTSGGALPRWRGEGRELFYVAADGNLMSVPVRLEGREFEWSTPRQLFKMPMLGASYDVAPRGEKFLVLTPVEPSRQNELSVVINWQSLLRR